MTARSPRSPSARTASEGSRTASQGYGAVPFLYGCARAEALPGPILVALLGDLGWSGPAARSLLHRMVGYGMLDIERHGRLGRYRLAGIMQERFDALGSPAPPRPWDGRFHLITYQIPETRRRIRDSLLAAAHGHGYRLLRPGVLLNPSDTSVGFLGNYPADDVVTGWLEVAAERVPAVVERCWQIDQAAVELRSLVDDLSIVAREHRPAPAAETLRALYESAGTAISTLMLREALPITMLPADWPGNDLRGAIGTVSARLGPAAAEYVDRLIDDLGLSTLVVRVARSPAVFTRAQAPSG